MKEIFETVFLLASIQGVLLSAVIFFKKTNHTSNIFLSLVILALSSELFTSVYYSKGWYISHLYFAGFTYPVALSYGPLFYFYTKYLTGKQKHFRLIDSLHFLPLAAVYILILPVFFYSTPVKIAFIQRMVVDDQPLIYSIVERLLPLQGLIYTILMILLVMEYNRKIKNNFSNIEKINLDWLKYLTFGMIFCWSIVVVSSLLKFFVDIEDKLSIVLHVSVSVIIYSIGYLSLNQPEIFSKQIEENPVDQAREKYKKSGLDPAAADEIKSKLFDVMEKQKPYLDGDLTLAKLADLIDVSEHNLSEVINSKLNKTYYDFVNEYRVEEFKNKLQNPSTRNYSLIGIAFESGFKSKTSFNTIFKKITNQTPSEFKNSIVS